MSYLKWFLFWCHAALFGAFFIGVAYITSIYVGISGIFG